MIRNSAKALILKDGKLLLNSHLTSTGELYYDLPGGGQNPYETMEEAVVREVREETGLRVEPVRFAALCEEIFTNEDMRRRFPQYCHRCMHIFLELQRERQALEGGNRPLLFFWGQMRYDIGNT